MFDILNALYFGSIKTNELIGLLCISLMVIRRRYLVVKYGTGISQHIEQIDSHFFFCILRLRLVPIIIIVTLECNKKKTIIARIVWLKMNA